MRSWSVKEISGHRCISPDSFSDSPDFCFFFAFLASSSPIERSSLETGSEAALNLKLTWDLEVKSPVGQLPGAVEEPLLAELESLVVGEERGRGNFSSEVCGGDVVCAVVADEALEGPLLADRRVLLLEEPHHLNERGVKAGGQEVADVNLE